MAASGEKPSRDTDPAGGDGRRDGPEETGRPRLAWLPGRRADDDTWYRIRPVGGTRPAHAEREERAAALRRRRGDPATALTVIPGEKGTQPSDPASP